MKLTVWQHITRSLYLNLFIMACLLVCVGCGSDQVVVEGTVNYNGQPVEEGTIVFGTADGRGGSASAPIEAGKYMLSADATTITGEKIVRIKAMRKTGRQIEAGPPSPPGTMVDQIEKYLPNIYNSQQSPLRCKVVAVEINQHNFELKSQ